MESSRSLLGPGVADSWWSAFLTRFPGTSVAACPLTSLSFPFLERLFPCPVHTVALWLCYELPEEAHGGFRDTVEEARASLEPRFL